ncbi:hypothetical protein Tco_1551174 [Tanacetum coccineum]
MSDMTALLNDLSYIPSNDEHNEPTQGDISETSNEPTQATRNEFEELYASANEELYPGCDYVTRLDFMTKFTYFKVKGRLTDSMFNEMLEFFQNVFSISKGYKLPPSYYAIKKTFKTIGLGLFPNKDMKQEFPEWFGSHIRQRHVDNDKDPEVSTTSELFALACGPTWTPISINYCVVDGVRYVVHSRDECRTTYGQLQEILEFKYLLFKVVLFRVKWFDTRNQGRKVKRLVLRNNMTQINCRGEAFKNDQYILVTQVKQVFYLEDKAKPHLKVVEHVNHKKFSNWGVIVVEDDPDIIHFDNSSDLPLSTSLNDLDNATLHIDGQSMEVDAPPDIIDVVDQDDDITDDEDALPHDLAASDDEDLINVDDDGVDKV